MARCIKVASALALGWIPYYEHLADVKGEHYQAYARGGKKKEIATDMLFYSGNDQPPEEIFNQTRSFTEYLESKNYRGALHIYNIEVQVDDDDFCDVNFDYIDPKTTIGYTPLRFPLIRSKSVWLYSKGEGSDNEPSFRNTRDGVKISFEVQFRIGRLGNLGAKLLTKYWAPFVWMRVDYDIKHSGAVTVEFSGSYIPTQLHYMIGPGEQCSQMYSHDMEGNTPRQLASVMASNKKKAKGNYFYECNNTSWNC